MHKSHELIPSEAMRRRMHLWRFGHFGAPILVFPSAAGMAHEWDAHGMIDTLRELIDGGKIKLYCTESNVSEAWTGRQGHPSSRIQRHRAFEQYVLSELVPYIRSDCKTKGISITTAGCSLGAFYACNFVLKHPGVFRHALCMSGRYDMAEFCHGFTNLDVYYNNPMAYVANLEGEELERVRRDAHLVLVCGQGRYEDGNIQETTALADVLARKQISHEKDLWGHDVDHSWEWWRKQSLHHLRRTFGS